MAKEGRLPPHLPLASVAIHNRDEESTQIDTFAWFKSRQLTEFYEDSILEFFFTSTTGYAATWKLVFRQYCTVLINARTFWLEGLIDTGDDQYDCRV